jgi:hypothetical protein
MSHVYTVPAAFNWSTYSTALMFVRHTNPCAAQNLSFLFTRKSELKSKLKLTSHRIIYTQLGEEFTLDLCLLNYKLLDIIFEG